MDLFTVDVCTGPVGKHRICQYGGNGVDSEVLLTRSMQERQLTTGNMAHDVTRYTSQPAVTRINTQTTIEHNPNVMTDAVTEPKQ